MLKLKSIFYTIVCAALLSACSDGPKGPDDDPNDNPVEGGDVVGFYILNEGNWGQNKASLDYFSYEDNKYTANIYATRNPGTVLGLGDVGNDIAEYNGRIYAVINGSNKVEIIDAATAERIGQVNIDNCRNIAFDGNYAYVSSFVGGEGDCGSVTRFDLTTFSLSGSVSVGKQPEEIVISNGYLYVANSGQFQAPDYDRTITVVRLSDFTYYGSIDVAINMHHLRIDDDGNLWVTSRGNYADVPSNIYKLPKVGDNTFGAPKALDVPCTNLALNDGKVYFYGTTYDENWNATYNYGVIDCATAKIQPQSFITDGTEKSLVAPYGIAVQPSTGDIILTDARNYVSSGQVRCYSSEGKLLWTNTAGDIPGHIAFVKEK